ncbi:hypothetical protein [Nonomuraea sp. NPDC049480]|uniref:hypothetical protein n=1 Tax=Nonomuraea sp. NPDC049480 TaxID=3364353 RepID=UPI0037A18FAC
MFEAGGRWQVIASGLTPLPVLAAFQRYLLGRAINDVMMTVTAKITEMMTIATGQSMMASFHRA